MRSGDKTYGRLREAGIVKQIADTILQEGGLAYLAKVGPRQLAVLASCGLAVLVLRDVEAAKELADLSLAQEKTIIPDNLSCE